MSLAIDIDEIEAVLLPDGWHAVHNDSFAVDSYELIWYGGGGKTDVDPLVLFGEGIGFEFLELQMDSGRAEISTIAGPMSSVQAIRLARR